MVEKLFIKHKLLSLKEKKRKANGNTVSSPPSQVDRGRRGSERRPQSEYHTGHQLRREERRKSKSLQRLNEAMDLDNFDFKANGMAFIPDLVRNKVPSVSSGSEIADTFSSNSYS